MHILQKLTNPNQKLSKSARKIADIVLDDPRLIINTTTAKLATQAGVSEPSVNRFCRSLGCEGFPDFKVKLAQNLANGTPKITRCVETNDSVPDIIEKIFDSTHASLTNTQALLDSTTIERAVDLLAQAHSIMFFGAGASGSVALDAQHKFLRFNTPVIAHVDPLNQRMVAAGLDQQDVVVCISYTGRTLAMVDVAEIAHQAGASVIGITAAGSPLAEQCTLTLTVDTPENTDVYTPMTSRIDHLVLIDVLATGVAIKRGPRFSQHLQQIKESLVATRLPAKSKSK